MSLLSNGPFSHNRFSALDELYQKERQYFTEKKAKPDFLDVDGDGDEKESFKKGLKDKEKGDKKKEGKKDKCECKEDVLDYLVQEGFASNEVSAEVLYNHMSEGWREHLEEVSEGYGKKMKKDKKWVVDNYHKYWYTWSVQHLEYDCRGSKSRSPNSELRKYS